MLIALLLAWALMGGVHPVAVGAVVLAVWEPVWFLAAAAAWGVYVRLGSRGRWDPIAGETAFLQGIAAELGAGASLRIALAGAASRAPDLPLVPAVRRAVTGRPASEVAGCLAEALPVNGRLAGAAFRVASATGGRSAEVFAGLALRATEVRRLQEERRAATAQARLSAWILAGAPLGGLVLLAAAGRTDVFFEFGRVGVGLLVAGVVLVGAGAGWIWWMQRRGGR